MSGGVFLDTSALYAVFHAEDQCHQRAAETWEDLIRSGAALHTSSHVLLELVSLLQRRLGISAVEALTTHVLPWVHVVWIDERLHVQGTATLLAAQRRDLSLADCTSFAVMRALGLRKVFTLDPHFSEQGFTTLCGPVSGNQPAAE
jgi:uncharacterized protein